MGVFDSIQFGCPYCNETVTVQSKGGMCIMANYTFEQLKRDKRYGILMDLDGRDVTCPNCNEILKIQVTVADINVNVI